MSEPVQIPPTLAIFEDSGDFTVRVGTQSNAQSIAQAIVPLIAKLGARKLLLITPMDTKVFKFSTEEGERGAEGRGPINSAPRLRTIQDAGAPPGPEEADEEFARYQAAEREAERIAAEQQSTATADPELPPEEEPPVRRSRAKVLPTQNVCGRCAGSGAIDGGGACPVCKGSGKIAQWGRKRG